MDFIFFATIFKQVRIGIGGKRHHSLNKIKSDLYVAADGGKA